MFSKIFILALLVILAESSLFNFNRGFARRFNGNNQFSDMPSFTLGSTFSFEAFVSPRGNGGPLLSLGDSDFITLSLVRNGSSNYHPQLIVREAGTTRTAIAPSNLVSNTWYRLVVTVSSNGAVQFYSGVGFNTPSLIGSGNVGTGLVRLRNTNRIGRNGNSYYRGDLDELRIWARTLDATEVSPLRTLSGAGLVLEYRFDEAANLCTDSSGNGRGCSPGGGNINRSPTRIVPDYTASDQCSLSGSGSVYTLDKFQHSVTATGEYAFFESSVVAFPSNIKAHVRINSQPGNSFQSGNGLSITAFAFSLNNQTVEFRTDYVNQRDTLVFINGVETLISASQSVSVGGISISREDGRRTRHSYSIILNQVVAFELRANPRRHLCNLRMRLARSPFRNSAGNKGLCGNYDTNKLNDGSVSTTPTLPSLFLLPFSPQVISSFACDINQLPVTQPLRDLAFLICNNTAIVDPQFNAACLTAVCVTGDISAAQDAAEDTYQLCLDNQVDNETTDCVQPCPGFCSFHGNCSAGVCTCEAGYGGADCGDQAQFPCYTASNNGNTYRISPFSDYKTPATHYSYNSRFGSSSDTGNEVSNANVMYLYQRQQDVYGVVPPANLSLVWIFDKPNDGTGGSVSGSIKATSGSNPLTGLSLIVKDDPSDNFADGPLAATGQMNFSTAWAPCCTDGFVLGSLPSTFCVDVTLQSSTGLSRSYLSDPNQFGAQDIRDVSPVSTLSVCGTTCNNTCSYTSCDPCMADPACGWCAATGSCEMGDAFGPFDGRCNNWRFTDDEITSRTRASEPGFPVDPVSLSIFQGANTAHARFYVNFPPASRTALDVMFLQDALSATGVANLKSNFGSWLSAVRSAYPSSRFGLMSFGNTPDQSLNLLQSLTSDLNLMATAASQLSLSLESSSLNAQLAALNVVSGSWSGWGDNVRRLAVVLTDSSFAQNGIYPSVSALRSALLSANVVPVFLTSSDYLSEYQSLVNSLGFGYVQAGGCTSALLISVMRSIGSSATPVTPYGTLTPLTYTGISPFTRVQFDLALPANSPSFTIVIPGYGSTEISIVPSGNPVAIGCVNNSYLVTNTSEPVLFSLQASSSDPLVADLLTLPASGNVFQYDGTPIVAPGPLTDPLHRFWYFASASGSFSIVGKLSDSCLACTPDITCNVIVAPNAPTNQPPVVTSGSSFSLSEDTPTWIPTTASDPENHAVGMVVTAVPTHGHLEYPQGNSLLLGGHFPAVNVLYVPDANYNGPDSFSFYAEDAFGASSSTFTVSLTITPVNDPPIAADFSATTDEDTSIDLSLIGSDIESSISFSIVSVNSGSVNLVGSTATFTPSSNFNGVASFIYRVTDTGSLYTDGTVTVTVNAVNDAPTAGALTIPAFEDTVVSFNLIGSDIETSVTFSIVSLTSGNAVLNGNIVTFTPDANMFGTVTLSYLVTDSGLPLPSLSTFGSAEINVASVNDAPVANSASVTTQEDVPLLITLTGSDVESSSLSFVVCSGPTQGSLGSLTGSGSSVNVTYTPNSSYSGTDSFVFAVSDGSLGGCGTSSEGTVSIQVSYIDNPPSCPSPFPTAPAIQEDSSNNAYNLTVIDIDSTVFTFALVSVTPGVTTTLNPNTGSLTVTPAPDATSTITVLYSVSDGNNTASPCRVDFPINAVNDPPIAQNYTGGTQSGSAFSTGEDTSINITLFGSDVETPVTFSIVGSASNGVVVLNGNVATFTPNLNFFGPASFTYRVTDSGFPPPALFADGVVQILVQSINDAPNATSTTASVGQSQSVSISLAGTDVDTSVLSFDICSGPSHGSLSAVPPSSGQSVNVIFTASNTFVGSDSFTFGVYDGELGGCSSVEGTVDITITALSRPTANSLPPQSLSAGQSVDLCPTGTDPASGVLSAAIFSQPLYGTVNMINSSCFTYTAPLAYNGPDSFSFTLTSSITLYSSDPSVVDISISFVNLPPTLSYSPQTILEDTPTDITFVGDEPNAGQTFSGFSFAYPSNSGCTFRFLNGTQVPFSCFISTGFNAVLTVSTLQDMNGQCTFTAVPQSSFGPNTDTGAQVNGVITITPVNDAPVVTPGQITTVGGVGDTTYTILGSDVDSAITQGRFVALSNNLVSPRYANNSVIPAGELFPSQSIRLVRPVTTNKGLSLLNVTLLDAESSESQFGIVTVSVFPSNGPPTPYAPLPASSSPFENPIQSASPASFTIAFRSESPVALAISNMEFPFKRTDGANMANFASAWTVRYCTATAINSTFGCAGTNNWNPLSTNSVEMKVTGAMVPQAIIQKTSSFCGTQSGTNCYLSVLRFTPPADFTGDPLLIWATRLISDTYTFVPVPINVVNVNSAPVPHVGAATVTTTPYRFDTFSVTDADSGSGNVSFALSGDANSIRVEVAGSNPRVEITVNSATSFTLVGSVSEINSLLAQGVYVDLAGAASSSVLTMETNDFGNTGGAPAGMIKTTTVNRTTQSGNPALQISAAGTIVILASVGFGVYTVLKKKKLLPEEEKPWAIDSEFDATSANPIYGETSQQPIYNA